MGWWREYGYVPLRMSRQIRPSLSVRWGIEGVCKCMWNINEETGVCAYRY